MADAELEHTVFHAIQSINGLDSADQFYEFKLALIEGLAENIFSQKEIMDERWRQCMNRDDKSL